MRASYRKIHNFQVQQNQKNKSFNINWEII